MKKGITKSLYRLAMACLLLVAAFPGLTQAQKERTKEVDRSFSGKQMVMVDHRHGPLKVFKSNDGQVRVEAVLSVEAKSESDAQLVLDRFDIEVKEQADMLRLTTKFEVKNWSTTNNETKPDL